ncbi:MAG TPA: isopentenyl-diphosphate Delta-isomerase [Woeseiaceae bacterium]|nr:isopentenyl-diphosphate Delta-isomerase [Woeseiaceae bacterium]
MKPDDRVVSSEAEELILVDEHDNEIGHLAKADAHDGSGVLHRAFSVFLFDDTGRLLLQRRASGKRLWPGYWSNTCCSHPRRGESLRVATARRLAEELNIEARLEFVYKFCYRAGYGDSGSENELCHVYLGRAPGNVRPNTNEISGVRYLGAADLEQAFADAPERYTPWFRMEWQALRAEHAAQLEGYIEPRGAG